MNFLLALVSWYLAIKIYGLWESEVRNNGRHITGLEINYTVGVVLLLVLGLVFFLVALL